MRQVLANIVKSSSEPLTGFDSRLLNLPDIVFPAFLRTMFNAKLTEIDEEIEILQAEIAQKQMRIQELKSDRTRIETIRDEATKAVQRLDAIFLVIDENFGNQAESLKREAKAEISERLFAEFYAPDVVDTFKTGQLAPTEEPPQITDTIDIDIEQPLGEEITANQLLGLEPLPWGANLAWNDLKILAKYKGVAVNGRKRPQIVSDLLKVKVTAADFED